MANPQTDTLDGVANYYSEKLVQHGQTARGVDWNGEASQLLRFGQLCAIIDREQHYSLQDLGCGYGALLDYLLASNDSFEYCGIDVAEPMVQAAKARHSRRKNARFIVATEPDGITDYCIASGIFSVRLSAPDQQWLRYIEATLEAMNRASRRGFSFNCLTSYSDPEKMKPNLFYADPCAIFDLCKRRFSKEVALLHDYGLYEFTIHVRKSP